MPSVSRKSVLAPPLAFIPPLAPTLVAEPPAGENWTHEIKHDGFRTLLLVDRGVVRAFTRRGHDWTKRYRRIVAAAAGLPCQAAIVDGEAVAQDASGRSDLAFLHEVREKEPHRLVFFAFDLLRLDGDDLRRQPLEERRGKLRGLIASDPHSAIQFSEAIVGDGPTVFAAAERMGLEASSRSGSAAAIGVALRAIG